LTTDARRTHWQITKSEAVAKRAMVTARHPLAVEAGLDVLRRGGNAVDAAVTMAFVLAVVEPGSCGVGGGGLMIVHQADASRTLVVDFAMDCPRAATSDAYELEDAVGSSRFGWLKVRGDLNVVGYRAAAVPGLVRGMALALERFGTISLREALQPAIAVAEEGFPVPWNLALTISASMSILLAHPASVEIFLPGGVPPRTGDLLVQRDLAQTLRSVAEQGADAFYRGSIAETIEREVLGRGGLLGASDLAAYQPTIGEGITTTYRSDTVVAVPGACGGITALQSLNMLERFDLSALPATSLEALHLKAEAFRRAFADRFRYVGDPKQGRVPWQGLLSKAYAAERAAEIDPHRATEQVLPGDPWAHEDAREPDLPRPLAWGSGGASTSHLNVVDHDRNVVTLTHTLVNVFGSGAVVPGTGVVLNNAMLWVDPEPGRPNSIGPGKRGLNNLTPLLVLREGRPRLALGAPGGAAIINAVSQVLSGVLDHGLTIQQAIELPRIDCSTAQVMVDARAPAEVTSGLVGLGHRVRLVEETFAAANLATPLAILIDSRGHLHGGVDALRPATASGL
jgi:gamma-glutamyltranspeptidase/glutathione hydrolase